MDILKLTETLDTMKILDSIADTRLIVKLSTFGIVIYFQFERLGVR